MTCIYQTSVPGEADVRVAIVARAEAQLRVHRVASRSLAHGGALWYVTSSKQDADVRIFMTSVAMAQLRVCFVDSARESGWAAPGHPLGRLFP